MRTIKTCPGIGDSIWLFMKLINAKEKFHWQIGSGAPQRGKQIFDLMPDIAESCEYTAGLGYNVISTRNITKMCRFWWTIKMQEFYLSINAHLEAGKRIEDFLPDLPTSYTLNYATTLNDAYDAVKIFAGQERVSAGPYMGIYASAYSTQRAWDFWDEKKWFQFIQLIHNENPKMVFVVIGAAFDIDLGSNLLLLMDEARIPYIDTIGSPLPVVIEIMKALHYFVGFPSGLSILNETLGKDGFMFYPPHLSKMINAWASLDRINSGGYKGALFCEPAEAFDWIRNKYLLFDRLK